MQTRPRARLDPSLKEGDCGAHWFNDQTPASAADLIGGTPGLELVETFLTGDQLGRAQGWTNVLARRAEQL